MADVFYVRCNLRDGCQESSFLSDLGGFGFQAAIDILKRKVIADHEPDFS